MNKNLATDSLANSKYFQSSKAKTDEFFKDSKVGSCSHVIVKNGQSICIPFKILNQKGKPLQHYKYTLNKLDEEKSVYRKDYCIKPNMHAGMPNKPLMPYHPDSYRNRLPTGGIIMPHKNKSTLELGDNG